MDRDHSLVRTKDRRASHNDSADSSQVAQICQFWPATDAMRHPLSGHAGLHL